jgi:hypothetical protein
MKPVCREPNRGGFWDFLCAVRLAAWNHGPKDRARSRGTWKHGNREPMGPGAILQEMTQRGFNGPDEGWVGSPCIRGHRSLLGQSGDHVAEP